ncbi:MAG: hypothetical protein PHI96_07320, partial [Desulfovibrio sp.]|nr:hypothetical protein [Desulfovibrio sp.]
ALLAVPAWDVDELAARTIVMAAMEDESIYAIKVQTPKGMLEGQRRNYQWEPVPWDDEMDEEAVAGLSPLRMEGRPVGTVEVYVSPRLSQEGSALTARREVWRFAVSLMCWTAALYFVWRMRLRRNETFDDNGQLGSTQGGKAAAASSARAAALTGTSGQAGGAQYASGGSVAQEESTPGGEAPASPVTPLTAGEVVSPALGLAFVRRHDHAWQVTAGLFRHSFAHAPGLMSRLYEEGDSASLCRLGDLLERAAPCLGAERLTAAASDMQTALHGPDGLRKTLAVEECILALDEVLDALR